jgi:hypothetical protein
MYCLPMVMRPTRVKRGRILDIVSPSVGHFVLFVEAPLSSGAVKGDTALEDDAIKPLMRIPCFKHPLTLPVSFLRFQVQLIMIALSILPLLLATAAVAAPSRRHGTFRGDCDVPASAVALPSSLDPLPSPPNLFLLGVGVQNYTCNSNGTFE